MENNTISKKNTGIVILILILLVLGLGGYIVYDKFIKEKPIENNNNNTEKVEGKLDSNRDWVYDASYEYTVSKNSYSTNFETYYVSDIKVPYINIDSKDAKNANLEIKNIFESAISSYNSGILDGQTYVDKCDYSSVINDNILSIILTFGIGSTDIVHPNYYTYNFDLNTGKLLSYKDGYEKIGYTSSTILVSVKNAITKVMTEKLKDFKDPKTDTGDGSYYPDDTNFDTYNNESISNYTTSINNNNILYFIDSNKKINVIITLSIPGGTGKFDTIITID